MGQRVADSEIGTLDRSTETISSSRNGMIQESVRCSVLQCVTVCYNMWKCVLQCVAVCCSVSQRVVDS